MSSICLVFLSFNKRQETKLRPGFSELAQALFQLCPGKTAVVFLNVGTEDRFEVLAEVMADRGRER
jgi:hypothetical protein